VIGEPPIACADFSADTSSRVRVRSDGDGLNLLACRSRKWWTH
jgi:hypothetical protein